MLDWRGRALGLGSSRDKQVVLAALVDRLTLRTTPQQETPGCGKRQGRRDPRPQRNLTERTRSFRWRGDGVRDRRERLLQRRRGQALDRRRSNVGRNRLLRRRSGSRSAWRSRSLGVAGLRRTGGGGAQGRRADRRSLRPSRSGHRRLVRLASDGALEVEILKLAGPNRDRGRR